MTRTHYDRARVRIREHLPTSSTNESIVQHKASHPISPGGGSRAPLTRQTGTEALEDALRQLYVLDAIDPDGVITPLGKRMAMLPLDPSLARAVIEAVRAPRLSAVPPVFDALSMSKTIICTWCEFHRCGGRQRPGDTASVAW